MKENEDGHSIVYNSENSISDQKDDNQVNIIKDNEKEELYVNIKSNQDSEKTGNNEETIIKELRVETE